MNIGREYPTIYQPPRDELESVLKDRRDQHGDFRIQFEVAQKLKDVLKDQNYHKLNLILKETLDQICHKLSRIVTGDPNHSDHWRDIAGYATLITNMLEGK